MAVAREHRPTITFLSDFGLVDEWVAVCKGVMLGIAQDARIIDVSHEIPPFDVKKGALVLADALPYLPKGVHLAVVDPGVGTQRRPVALATGDGNVLVGPDNGLMTYAAAALGGVTAAVEIANEKYLRKTECQTFHGRDIFAPAAAHLATGVALADLGPPVDLEALVGPPWPEPRAEDHFVVCEVIDIDRFGTLRLNAGPEQLGQLGVDTRAGTLDVAFGHHELALPLGCTFGDVAVGKAVLLFDSSGLLCLALNQASAAAEYDLAVGDNVTLRKG
jgi:S-adenosylmethionine hydrolase